MIAVEHRVGQIFAGAGESSVETSTFPGDVPHGKRQFLPSIKNPQERFKILLGSSFIERNPNRLRIHNPQIHLPRFGGFDEVFAVPLAQVDRKRVKVVLGEYVVAELAQTPGQNVGH